MTAGRKSKLALGTVQFGMRYGIANAIGQPSIDEVRAILSAAARAGIMMIDTAHAYGKAEAVLGSCLDGLDFHIVTKVPPLRAATITSQDIDLLVEAFQHSLLRLRRERLYGLLAHDADDVLAPGGERLWTWLMSLREAGMIEKIGVSVYSPQQLQRVLEGCETLQLVQLPFSIYDQRFARSGLLDLLKERQIEVHARSPFLQGLLLMAPDNLPKQFASIREHQTALHAWLRERGLNPLSGALATPIGDTRINFAVVGCETLRQFSEIAAAAETQAELEGIGRFAISDEAMINPSQWGAPN